jgi:hypothetical protein|tara:strand:- start:357 stop:590 length:234 start_codon:yes stop_codon:yes gene_type:complete
MALIQNINGVPAYTTIQEALSWGNQFGLTSYHTHIINGQTAYMAGITHDEVTSAARSSAGPTNSSNSSSSSNNSSGY